jgi:hypothetical protein
MAMPLAAAPYRASGLVLWRKADAALFGASRLAHETHAAHRP